MKIRPITAADRRPLEELLNRDQTFRADEIAVALELIDEAIAGSSDYWIRIADVGVDSQPWAANAGVAGYVCYGPTPMTASTYDLYWLVTHPAARRRGLARALVKAMEADLRARQGTAVRVETADGDNYDAARQFYQQLGYPQAARLHDFYGPGDGLVLYYKHL